MGSLVEISMGTLLVAVVLLSINQALSDSPIECGSFPCENPTCCKSGELTTDINGCCQECAKGLLETCGGPFGRDGNCARDLNCLRTCPCSTSVKKRNRFVTTPCVFPFKYKGKFYASCTKDHTTNGKAWCATKVDNQGNAIEGSWGDCNNDCFKVSSCTTTVNRRNRKCILPFSYKGSTYSSCTTDHTTNGKAWCATKVDNQGNVVEGSWGDCNDDCFSRSNQNYCDDSDFFNEVGRCIRRYEVEPDLQRQVVRYKIDENYGYDNNQIRTCGGRGNNKKCECNLNTNYGQSGENCEQLPGGSLAYCFLENIQNPSNPRQNCYSDVEFNSSVGKFYSKEACYDYIAVEPPPGDFDY